MSIPCYWATCGSLGLPDARGCETILDGTTTLSLSPAGRGYLIAELAVVLAVTNMPVALGDVKLHIPRLNNGWEVEGDHAYAMVRYRGKDVVAQQLVEPQSEAWMQRFEMVRDSVRRAGLRVDDPVMGQLELIGRPPTGQRESPAIELVQTILAIVVGANAHQKNLSAAEATEVSAFGDAILPTVRELALTIDRLRKEPTIAVVALGLGTVPEATP